MLTHSTRLTSINIAIGIEQRIDSYNETETMHAQGLFENLFVEAL